jgi:hypothetical protein
VITRDTVVDHHYDTELTEERRMCDPTPTVHVRLIETITTTTAHPDGSTTVHTTEPRTVATWTHHPEEH